MYCLDLFAGAGGLSTGLELAGFKCLYANEISPVYAQTLASSHPNAFVETGSIREVNAANVRRALQLEKGELHLLAGGPPCQGFSVNAPVRSADDERNHLFRDYLRFVEEFEPRTILIENVPGMISFERGQTVTEILQCLRALGYSATIRILYAPHYGVPQMRWRAIVLGNRFGVDPALMYPIPSHKAVGRANFTTKHQNQSLILPFDRANATSVRKHVSIWEAISDLPEIDNGRGVDGIPYPSKPLTEYQRNARAGSSHLTNHKCAGLGKANLVRLPHIPQGGSWRDIPFDLLPKGLQRARRSDHTKRYGRLHPDEVGSTILTKCDPHWGTYIHPFQDRIISVREAARIQSFPDSVEFKGSLTDQYEQVGNAVPPLFAKAIGERVASIISHHDTDTFEELISSPWTLDQISMPI